MLVNKRITVGNINLLMFLFPNYSLINEFNIPDIPNRPAIYSGSLDYIDLFLQKYEFKDYIVVSKYSEIDLNDRRVLSNIVFEKWRNGYLPKYLDNFIDNIDYNDFIEAIKIKWVTGKWIITKLSDENSFLQLIEILNKSKLELMKTYFNVIKNNKTYKIESSILTFLNKAKDKTYVGDSFEYKKKLEMFKGNKLDKCLDGINDSLDYNIDNDELRLLNMIISMSGKK